MPGQAKIIVFLGTLVASTSVSSKGGMGPQEVPQGLSRLGLLRCLFECSRKSRSKNFCEDSLNFIFEFSFYT